MSKHSVLLTLTLSLAGLTSPTLQAQENPADTAPLSTIDVTPLREERAPPAATNTAETATQLETIIVTGEKLGRTLDETASSVAVVSGRQIEEYGDNSVQDAFSRMANVTAEEDGLFSIRGVSVNGATDVGGQPVISTYLDGIALDANSQGGAILDSFDIEQIEVLRGPQSTSQGRNALAGAVVVNTREPTPYWDLLMRVRVEGLGGKQYSLAGGGPLGDSFAFRLVGDYQSSDGDVTNVTRNDPKWGATRKQLARAKLAWQPTFAPDLSMLLTVSHSELDGNRPYLFEPESEGDAAHRNAYDNEPGKRTNRSTPSSLRIRYSFSPNYELTATTGFVQSRLNGDQDGDQGSFDGGRIRIDNRGRNATQELRLSVRDVHGFTGIVGLYAGTFRDRTLYDNTDTQIPLSQILPLPIIGDLVAARVDVHNYAQQESENAALFAEFDYDASERLTLTAGLRYDREWKSVDSDYNVTRADAFVVPPAWLPQLPLLDAVLGALPPINVLPVMRAAGAIPGTNGARTTDARYDALLPKFGLRYALTEQLGVFLTWSKAYRAGGTDIIAGTGETVDYDPEYTQTWEAGVRGRFFEGRLQSRLNLYHTDWRDQQVTLLGDDGVSYYRQNAANSKLYGAEFEHQLRLARQWQLFANLGYSHAQFENYTSDGIDYSGNRFIVSPRLTAGVGGVWRSDRGWFASAQYSHTDAYFLTPENDPREKSDLRRLLGARLGYEHAQGSIYLYGRNLLDEDYAVTRYVFVPSLGIPAPGMLNSYGDPRVIGVQIEARF